MQFQKPKLQMQDQTVSKEKTKSEHIPSPKKKVSVQETTRLPVLLCWPLRPPKRSLFAVWNPGDMTNGGDFKAIVSSGLVIRKSPCGDKTQQTSSELAVK